MNLVLFDFDKTIVSKDTGEAFIKYAFKRSPLRSLLALLLFPIALPTLFSSHTKIFGFSLFLWAATVGLSKREMVSLRNEFTNHYMALPAVVIYKDALESITAHRKKADRIVVISGASDWMVKKIFNYIGLKHMEIIGSKETIFAWGMVSKFHCFASKKVCAVNRHLNVRLYSNIVGYSDSATDIPILTLCNERIIVNPNESSLAKFKKRFGHQMAVVNWA